MGAKLNALWATVKSELGDMWQKSKMWILAAVAIVIALEWRKLKEKWLVNAGNKQIQSSNKQDQALASQEKIDNAGAEALIKEAAELPAEAPPVQTDWYKTEGDK